MNKLEKYELDNGLMLLFYKDNTKHNTRADIFLNFGGQNKEVFCNNKKIKIKDGTAHFIEHLLIEHSMYGNIITEFSKKRIYTNGSTGSNYTHYYIDTVENFEENLVKELNMINIPVFTKENIEETRPAILKEKMMSEDSISRAINKMEYKSLFSKYKYSNTLGEVEDIKSLNYEEIKQIYDLFYQPSNQIIIISGNFESEKIKKIIEKQYSKYKREVLKYDLPIIKEPHKVNKKEDFIKKDVHGTFISINYKLYTGNLSIIELLDLDYYLYYFLEDNFSTTSEAYKKLIDNKISNSAISFNSYKKGDYFVVSISCYTDNHSEFIKLIQDTINNKAFDKELFEINKNESIIRFIKRNDKLMDILNPLFNNFEFNYYELDKIEDIERQNYNDYKKTINNLDFSNCSITKVLREDDINA